MPGRKMVVLVNLVLALLPAARLDAGVFDVNDRCVRISAGPLERVLDIGNGNLSTTSLRVDGHELLAGPAVELSFVVTRAEPNGRPKGLASDEGGSIDSVQTFRPGQHVDPGTYDDATLGQATRWVHPVRIQAGRWTDAFVLTGPEISTPSADVSRLTISARARPGSDLDGLAVTVIYEVYRDEPVVRKWVEIANASSVWRKIEQLTIDDFTLAPGVSERVPLTPAGYGAQPSMIGFVSSDGTFGVIAASEIPSALRAMAEHSAMGYHPTMFEWVLGPAEQFVSEPVFLYAFSGPVEQTVSARSTPLDRAVEGPFKRFVSRHIGIVGERLPCDAPQWLTWATFGPNLDDALIRRQADLAARAGFVQFLIDDGWQRDRLGTEPNPVTFPDFAATADYIRSRGLKLGLWLSCFRDANSPDRKAMPDARSLPVVTRLGGIAMSFTTPWRQFYAADLARLHERYGAAYFKQDFSNIIYGDLAEGHPNRTRKESLLRGLRGLLEAQDRLRALAPEVMNELTHEIYWDTPGAPCDLAALKHAARYHVSPNACRGIAPRPRPGQGPPAVDPQKLRDELLAACCQARQIFYSHRGLPLYCLEFYGAATEDHEGSLTRQVQDRQVVSWLMGAPLVFSGDLSTLSDEHLAHYRKRFALVNRLHQAWDIYRHFQFSGVPAPNDDDWHWWGKLNDDGCGAVVVVRGSGGDERRAINIPWVRPERRYTVTALFAERPVGEFSGRQLRAGEVELSLPAYGQEILELTAAHAAPVPDAATAAAPDAHLDYAPGKAPRFWSVATAETIMARWPDYNLAYHASWTYVHGYALYGFDMLYRATGDQRYYDFIKRYIDKHIDENGGFRVVVDGRGRERATSFGNQDNMMTGNTLVMLYEYTRDERYKKAATTIRRALDGYPRNRNGGLWHSRGMNGQWWIDGIFMSQMFLTRYGKSLGDTQYCWDEATLQLGAYARSAERDHTGLYVHGIYEAGHGGKPARWADPNGGLSPEVWSEGLGWYALVLVETLADLPGDHARRAEMEDIFRRLAAGLKRTQDPGSGRWFQVVDKGDRPDNWTDTSGSAMFTYTIQRGIEIGLLDKAEYAPVVAKGYEGIVANARINDKGLVDIYSACDGLGVQASYDQYIHYKQSVNAKEAVAGFLWAATIVEKPELERRRTR